MFLLLETSSSIRSSSARSKGSKSWKSSSKLYVEELELVEGSTGIEGMGTMSSPVLGTTEFESSTETEFVSEGPAKIRAQSTPEMSAKSSGKSSNSSADIISKFQRQFQAMSKWSINRTEDKNRSCAIGRAWPDSKNMWFPIIHDRTRTIPDPAEIKKDFWWQCKSFA